MGVRKHWRDGKLVLFEIDGVPQPFTNEAQATKSQVVHNAIQAGGRIASALVTGKQIAASPEEIERRLDICKSCGYFTHFNNFRFIKCAKCGCALRLKTRLKTEHCPINKW